MSNIRIRGSFGGAFLVGQYPSSNAAILRQERVPDGTITLKMSKRTQIGVNGMANIRIRGSFGVVRGELSGGDALQHQNRCSGSELIDVRNLDLAGDRG